MNLSTKQKQIHRHRKQTHGCQGEVGWERDGLSSLPLGMRVWGKWIQTIIYRMEKQQGTTT